MKYLVVVPVPAYPIDPRRFAIESAFADHLKELLALLNPPFGELMVAGVRMSEEAYQAARDHLGVLEADRDRIRLSTLYDEEMGRLGFVRRFPWIARSLYRLVREHDVVHAGPAHDITRPASALALALGVALDKPTISVTDIDLRQDAVMSYGLGRWSRKSYLLCRYVYDPIRDLQQRFIVRHCSLVLFKSAALRDDYGRGRSNVRTFYDPSFSAEHVISQRALDEKIEALRDRRRPLEVLYFGRLAYYKGVDHALRAVAWASTLGREDVRLTIMGAGEEEGSLRALAAQLGLGERVVFRPPVRYGEEMFARIRPHHLMLGTPLTTDTPRSTWDAIASAMPVLAFDTEFYRDLASTTGLVETVPWPSAQALGERIAHYAEHREELVARMRSAPAIARESTSEAWLARRARWTLELLPEPARQAPRSPTPVVRAKPVESEPEPAHAA